MFRHRPLLPWCLLLVPTALLTLQRPNLSAQQTTVTRSKEGAVMGRTIEANSGAPLSGVIVTLGADRRALTDARGRFAFEAVAPGAYALVAARPGYADGAFGRLRPRGTPQTLDVRAGERVEGVTIPLWKYASLGGTLTDEAGEPVVDVQLQLLQHTTVAGRRAVVTAATTLTDDRGEYRFGGVLPGQYAIAVAAIPTTLPAATAEGFKQAFYAGTIGSLADEFKSSGVPIAAVGTSGTRIGDFFFQTSTGSVRPQVIPSPDSDGRLYVYPTQFYPGTRRLIDATSVTAVPGEERSSLDWRLQLVPGARVVGAIMGPHGPVPHLGVRLMPVADGDLTWEPAIEVAAAMTDAAGQFTFLGVPVGQYVLAAQKTPAVPTAQASAPPTGRPAVGGGRGGGARIPRPVVPGPTLWASVPVAVGTGGTHDVAVTLREGFRLSGRLEFDGVGRPPAQDTWRQIVVALAPADGRVNPLGVNLPLEGYVDRDGSIAAYALPPGRYVVRATNLPAGWFLRSAALGARDVADVPLELDRDTSGLVITLTDRAAVLAGTVRDAAGAADEAAAVVVFPADRSGWSDTGASPRRVRATRASPTGAFHFSGLPDGEYLAAAIPEEQGADWTNPRVLQALARTARAVTLREGDERSLDLQTQTQGVRLIRVAWNAPSADVRELKTRGNADAVDDTGPVVHGPAVEPDVADVLEPPVQQVRDPLARRATAGAAVLTGTIVSADDGARPLRRVRVLISASSRSVDREAVTDDAGRFAFTGLPAAAYRVSAYKAAYVRTEYGASRPQQAGTPVLLGDGERRDVSLRLTRGAVITGTILDHEGAPAPEVTVSVLRYAFSSRAGRRVLAAVAALRRVTDDRGVYRFYGLAPGEYVVAAVPAPTQLSLTSLRVGPSAWDAPDGASGVPGVAFARGYYPGVTDAAQAIPVTVKAGEERGGIGFMMALVHTARLVGTVLGLDGAPAAGVTVARVLEGEPALSAMEEAGRSSRAVSDGSGRFSFTSVEPGHYRLDVRTPAGSRTPPAWATGDVNVFGADTSVQLNLQPTLTLSGHIDTSPPGALSDLSRVRVTLAPERGAGAGAQAGSPNATPDDTGAFRMTGVVPGRYRLIATAPAVDGGPFVLESIVVGGHEVLDLPFEIGPGAPVSDALLRLTNRISRLTGRLIDAEGRPVVDRSVLVFAAKPEYWPAQTRRIALARPAPDGRFTVETLPAGDYRLVVLDEVEGGDWLDPDLLAQFAPKALSITLAAGATVTQDLRVTAPRRGGRP